MTTSGSARPALDESELRELLESADIPILLMVLTQLTGERRWLEAPYGPLPSSGLFPSESGDLPAEIQREIRDAAAAAVTQGQPDRRPSDQLLAEMMSACVGEPVPAEYAELVLHEMSESELTRSAPAMPRTSEPEVLIIGAGISGVALAIQLQRAGIPYRIVEKNTELGGTWYDNQYPGCAVDTPNHLYAYSFAPNHSWSRYFSPQAEILQYVRDVADQFGVSQHIDFGTTVTSARFAETDLRWEIDTQREGSTHQYRARSMVSAVGLLNRPKYPTITGIEQFSGQSWHTARWPRDADIEGKRVGVIGTGASAMQVVPSIAGVAHQLFVFQRSPQWAVPNPLYRRALPDAKRRVLELVPHYATWYRFYLFWRFGDGLFASLRRDPAWPHPERSLNEVNDRHRGYMERHIRRELDGDEALLENCIPDYPPYTKRLLIDNNWFATMRRDDVELVADPIDRIEGGGVITTSGRQIELDVIIYATGFETLNPLAPIDVIGTNGRRLIDEWGVDDARAYLGITVPDFPNLFCMLGPNTALGHGGSAIFTAECQARYIVGAIEHSRRNDVALDVRRQEYVDYCRAVDEEHESLVWTHPTVSNWYRNSAGRVVTNCPWSMHRYWEMTRSFVPSAFHELAEVVATTASSAERSTS